MWVNYGILVISKEYLLFVYTRPDRDPAWLLETGTEVHATAAGKVARADFSKSYGNTVVVNHGNNIYTLYAHGSRLNVSVGNPVFTNQVIMLSGNTGKPSSGPHLHYEVVVSPYSPSAAAFYGDINLRRSPTDLRKLLNP